MALDRLRVAYGGIAEPPDEVLGRIRGRAGRRDRGHVVVPVERYLEAAGQLLGGDGRGQVRSDLFKQAGRLQHHNQAGGCQFPRAERVVDRGGFVVDQLCGGGKGAPPDDAGNAGADDGESRGATGQAPPSAQPEIENSPRVEGSGRGLVGVGCIHRELKINKEGRWPRLDAAAAVRLHQSAWGVTLPRGRPGRNPLRSRPPACAGRRSERAGRCWTGPFSRAGGRGRC